LKTYQQALDWMFKKLPMFQKVGDSAYRKDLDNILLLSDYLKRPEREIKTIHIAGTNGKGSVASMIASVMQEAGYKVGLYTSPHLKDFRERIKINGRKISKEYIQEFVTLNQPFFDKHDFSFFEMTTGMAFDYFREKEVDIAIIETGMGGRLDSTNIITPLVSVITNIGFDHTNFLGNTIEEITLEKTGIIKTNIPVVIGEYTRETKHIFLDEAWRKHAELFFASDILPNKTPKSDLTGKYQEKNKKAAIQVINILNEKKHFTISEQALNDGFAKVVENTKLLGRWQILHEKPKVICDIAHNTHGLRVILNQLEKERYKKLHIVFGTVQDKDLDEMLLLMPQKAVYYFCRPDVPRGLDLDVLLDTTHKYLLNGQAYPSVKQALKFAQERANERDLILVTGSTFVVAEVV